MHLWVVLDPLGAPGRQSGTNTDDSPNRPVDCSSAPIT
jgi:hypothetical protein